MNAVIKRMYREQQKRVMKRFHQPTTKELYQQAYRDARILKYQFPPQYPVAVQPIPLRIKLAARQSIEADYPYWHKAAGYTWINATRQHHFELLTSERLQY